MKKLMSGNEAIARGAWEAGVRFAAGYPGTPSTEVLESLATYDEIDAHWSTNEKVAFDEGMGAALGVLPWSRDALQKMRRGAVIGWAIAGAVVAGRGMYISAHAEEYAGFIQALQVTSGGGQAGAGKILRLRGINSLINREPLVFLDGIRLGRIGRASPGEARQVISLLDTLTPEAVARIEILRGSAATALYGSDGAGGVILIYTR